MTHIVTEDYDCIRATSSDYFHFFINLPIFFSVKWFVYKIVNYFNDQLIIQIIEIILIILFSAQSVTKRSVNLNIAVMQYLKS